LRTPAIPSGKIRLITSRVEDGMKSLLCRDVVATLESGHAGVKAQLDVREEALWREH